MLKKCIFFTINLMAVGTAVVQAQDAAKLQQLQTELGQLEASTNARGGTFTPQEVQRMKETQELTLNPHLVEFQNNLIAEYQEKNKTVKKGQTLFIGSSIMEIFPIEKWEEDGKVKFDQYIYNRAVRATTTQFVLDHINIQIFDLAPSKIFINIGTNDIGFQVPIEEFHANYEMIIRQIQDKLPDTEIFVLKYYPVNNVDFGAAEDEAVLFATRSNELFNAASEKNREMAEKLGVHFIDVSNGLADENGNLKKEYTFDGAHILPNGCEVILKNLEKYL